MSDVQKDKCPKCGSINNYQNPKGSHLGLYCSDCNSWIRWISQKQHTNTIKINSSDDVNYVKGYNDALSDVLQIIPVSDYIGISYLQELILQLTRK